MRLIAEGNEDLLPDFDAATTISDVDGSFMFPAVAPGRYLAAHHADSAVAGGATRTQRRHARARRIGVG